jgi:hypothetical protein
VSGEKNEKRQVPPKKESDSPPPGGTYSKAARDAHVVEPLDQTGVITGKESVVAQLDRFQ